MTPLLAAGAASIAGELVSRVAGAVSSSVKSPVSDALNLSKGRDFSRVLSRAAGNASQQQALADLQDRVWQMPEVMQAVAAQPVGSVTGAEVRADGSVAITTARGAVEVAVSAESRGAVHQIYRGMVALGMPASGVDAAGAISSLPSRLSRVPGVLVPARGL